MTLCCFGHFLSPAVLNLWVATPAGVTWRFTGGRLGPSEILKQSCQHINLLSSLPAMQPKVYFNVNYRFWVKCFALISCSSFPVINSLWNRISSLLVLLPILCFLSRFNWPKSSLLLLLGLFFRLSIYTCQHLIQYHLPSSSSCLLPLHFLSITILSSESPSMVCPIHFGFPFFRVHLLHIHITFHIFIESKRKNTAAKNTRKQSSVTMWDIKKLHQKTKNSRKLSKNLKKRIIQMLIWSMVEGSFFSNPFHHFF